jgi:hypothetical protein
MKVPKHSTCLPKMIVLLVIAIVLPNPLPLRSVVQAEITPTEDTACRMAIDAPLDIGESDIASLGVASLLDWGAVNNPSLPEGVEYIRVLRLRDDLYPETLANLPAWVKANPGSVWVVGNEPDTTYENQDALLPEVYADRYYELATLFRQLDRSAQIGFGPVVQPTPIRIRYLQRAWDRLVIDAGSTKAASQLVDIWTPHAFILNEDTRFYNNWGTGVPPGFETDHDDAFIIDIDHLYYTYSIDIFEPRISAFREWMASIGEREKPLWITEYGSLLPPMDPPPPPPPDPPIDYVNVSDEDTTAFMLDTFEFMLETSDAQSGMPADGNQLVQRWFWYSLNDHRYHFGGSLYNPDSPDFGPPVTLVGDSFIAYQADHLLEPDLYPSDLAVAAMSYNQDRTLVNYRLEITIDNSQFYDASCAKLEVYDGDPDSGGSLILGPLPASAIKADYGTGKAIVYWTEVQPLSEHKLCITVDPIGIEDLVPGNNMACYNVYLELPNLVFLPAIHK